MKRNHLLVLMLTLPILLACNLSDQREAPTIDATYGVPEAIVVDLAENEPEASAGLLQNPVTDHIREIYRAGMALGNRPMVFSKIGDSITANQGFLTPIGEGVYYLGEQHTYLQSIIDYFSLTPVGVGGANSFEYASLSAKTGWAAWGALSLDNSNPYLCQPLEMPIECEYRVTKPAFAIIMYGTNDVGYRELDDYRADMEQIIQISEANGVVPILSTIPPRFDVPQKVGLYNALLLELAVQYQIPIMDYYSEMIQLPNGGLAYDMLHPSTPPGGFMDTAIFTPENLQYGYAVRNLVTLEMLDAVVRAILGQA